LQDGARPVCDRLFGFFDDCHDIILLRIRLHDLL
jgi:hypothetical protein